MWLEIHTTVSQMWTICSPAVLLNNVLHPAGPLHTRHQQAGSLQAVQAGHLHRVQHQAGHPHHSPPGRLSPRDPPPGRSPPGRPPPGWLPPQVHHQAGSVPVVHHQAGKCSNTAMFQHHQALPQAHTHHAGVASSSTTPRRLHMVSFTIARGSITTTTLWILEHATPGSAEQLKDQQAVLLHRVLHKWSTWTCSSIDTRTCHNKGDWA